VGFFGQRNRPGFPREPFRHVAVLLDDQRDFEQAAARVRRLMFLEKLLFEIDDAMAASEA
jgi:molecular chaperone HscB